MLRKVTYAGSRSPSVIQANTDLESLAETNISRECVQRWTKRVEEECVRWDEALADAYQSLSLPEQQTSPTDQVPQVACVMMDGGRIQVRDRHEATPSKKGYWKESLVGCCLAMASREQAEDPSPLIPKTFVDPERIRDLAKEIKGVSTTVEDVDEPENEPPDDRVGRPEVLVRSVVATCQGPETLGRRLVAEAHSRGFHAARRKAFVGDGLATNWGVHRKHFSHFMPILDFTHAICYVNAAAMTGRDAAAGWRDYLPWAQWLWKGSINKLIEAIDARSQTLGPPPEGDETSPAALVAKTLCYLKNQHTRMDYPKYRMLGLPIISSHIESTIKRLNRRMKGTEKFWDQGAEPLLVLAAANLSETNRLARFWKDRQNQLQPVRQYNTAG